jgi:hypothetical protein
VKRHTHYPVPNNVMVNKELGKIIIFVRAKKAVDLNHHASRITHLASLMVLSRDQCRDKGSRSRATFVLRRHGPKVCAERNACIGAPAARPPRHISFSFVALSPPFHTHFCFFCSTQQVTAGALP